MNSLVLMNELDDQELLKNKNISYGIIENNFSFYF